MKTGGHSRNLWTARNTLTVKGCFSPPFCISLSTFKMKLVIVDLFEMIRTSSREQRELPPWLKLLQRRPPLKKPPRRLLRRSRLLRRRRSNVRARGRGPGIRLGTGTSDQANRSPIWTVSSFDSFEAEAAHTARFGLRTFWGGDVPVVELSRMTRSCAKVRCRPTPRSPGRPSR